MFTLQIETENAAFEGGRLSREVARLLRKVAEKVEQESEEGMIIDINGNRVGEYAYESKS